MGFLSTIRNLSSFLTDRPAPGLKKITEESKWGDTLCTDVYAVDEHGLKQGKFKSYLKSSGQLIQKCTYKDGKEKGPFERYFSNGNLAEKGSYLDEDHFDGPYVRYHENGQLREKSTYKNGLKHGLYESFSLDGKLVLREFYKGDKWDGPSERFDDTGRCVGRQVWRDGELLEGQEAEDYLKEWEKEQKKARRKARIEACKKDPEWQDLKDRLNHLTDDKYYKKTPLARTRERQVELEEIMMTRRSKTLLLRAATKARLAGDTDRFDAIMALAKPFAKKHELVMHVFRDKRAENKKRTRKNEGR